MFVLDTNVISELMRENPDSEVRSWLDDQPTSSLFVTAVTEAEVRAGIAVLPDGERRRGLAVAMERTFGVMFAERILSFASDAAQAYASIAAARRAAGHPISHADCQIAAIALSLGAAVAAKDIKGFEGCGPVGGRRNLDADVAAKDIKGFEGCGIDVINPWGEQ